MIAEKVEKTSKNGRIKGDFHKITEDILSNFDQIVKAYLSHLPKDDCPVLDTFKFVSIWLGLVLDQSQTSMRSMFKRLSIRGEKVDISTFSKASKKGM